MVHVDSPLLTRSSKYKRYITAALSHLELAYIAAHLADYGVTVKDDALYSTEILLYVSLGQATYQTDPNRPPIAGPHWIQTSRDPALDTLVDAIFTHLLSERFKQGDERASCSCDDCYAHISQFPVAGVPVQQSTSCVMSVQRNQPELYDFLTTAPESLLARYVREDNSFDVLYREHRRRKQRDPDPLKEVLITRAN